MQKIGNEHPIYFDVDNTLIMHVPPKHPIPEHEEDSLLYLTIPGTDITIRCYPHHDNIKLLKRSKAKNHTVIVWSHGGVDWAAYVVKQLKIEKYVDFVLHKVEKYVDDVPIEQWQFINLYLHDGFGKSVRKSK